MEDSIEEQIRNKERIINLKLRQAEPRVIQLHLQLKKFIAQLEQKNVLKDYNFDEYFYGYRMDYVLDNRRNDVIIKTRRLGSLDLYIEDEEYREHWNRQYFGSQYGELSILYNDVSRELFNHPELILAVDKIEVFFQIQYQVCVKASAIAKSKKLGKQAKLKAMGKAIVRPLQNLMKIKELERKEAGHLHKIGLLDIDRVSGELSLFSKNQHVNDKYSVVSGNPYIETAIDWSFLDQLKTWRIADLKAIGKITSKDLIKTSYMWLEHHVEYVIQVNLNTGKTR